MAKASVIITLTDRAGETLPPLLAALASQDDPQFEVLIADADGNPDHAALAQAWQKSSPVTLHYVSPGNTVLTPAAMRNRAASEAYGDYLIFLNDDCFVAPDFVRRHRQLAEAGWFVVTPPVRLGRPLSQRLRAGPDEPWRWSRLTWLLRFLRGECDGGGALLPLRVKAASPWRKATPLRCADVPDTHFALWRRDFAMVGGYDERFQEGSAFANRELALRLIRAGARRKDGDFLCLLFCWSPGEPTMEKAIAVNQNYILLQESMLDGRVLARPNVRADRQIA